LIPDLERWSARCEAEERALEEIRLAASASLASDAIVILCTVDALCRVEKLYYYSSSSRNSNNNNKKQRKPKPQQQRFLLIIDEAGTVPEYKIPLAVSLGVEAVIAVGDQNQLQPFTHTGAANNNGFFHRLAKATSSSSSMMMIMLEEQFRMHPTISGFVSASFYGDRLITNPEVASARCSVPRSGLCWVDYHGVDDDDASSSSSSALLLSVPEKKTPQQQQQQNNIPTKTKNHHRRHRTTTMIYNQTELDIVKTFLQDELPDLLSQGKTVMIITFYREQYHRLMLLGERLGLVGKRSRGGDEGEKEMMMMTTTTTTFFFTHPNFRISTVDASQGSESDVVVLSCVRCDPEKGIGFLSHPNRICVALSRAKERLVVVGNSKTLTAKSAVWGALYAWWCAGISPAVEL
jgi:superfamily I DNA and/or RNA helicase